MLERPAVGELRAIAGSLPEWRKTQRAGDWKLGGSERLVWRTYALSVDSVLG